MTFTLHRLNRVPYRHLLLVGLLGCLCSFPVWADERQTPKSLWQTVLTPPAADQQLTPRRPWVLLDREIALDLPLLQVLKDAGARPHPRITIELFDGANHELDITSTISRSNSLSRMTFARIARWAREDPRELWRMQKRLIIFGVTPCAGQRR